MATFLNLTTTAFPGFRGRTLRLYTLHFLPYEVKFPKRPFLLFSYFFSAFYKKIPRFACPWLPEILSKTSQILNFCGAFSSSSVNQWERERGDQLSILLTLSTAWLPLCNLLEPLPITNPVSLQNICLGLGLVDKFTIATLSPDSPQFRRHWKLNDLPRAPS